MDYNFSQWSVCMVMITCAYELLNRGNQEDVIE